jgi:ribonuclease P protein component
MAPNHLPYSRFAFVVGKRVSRKAVVRNKIRRRIREVVRQDPIQPGWDLVFIARAQSAEADFQALRDAVWNVERRARIRRSEGG